MTAYVAILGDLHGHYTLAFILLKRWERETGKKLDAVLQVGDMGIFPFPDVCLDDATRRFAERDPNEISFQDYFHGTGDAEFLFAGKNPLFDKPLYFIRGNHEDFAFLAVTENPTGIVGVDYYRQLFYLADGAMTEIETSAGVIRVGGLGGLEQRGEKQEPWQFANNAYRRALALSNIDVLLTHEPPSDEGRGSEKIRSLIEQVQPTYHFCGHIHEHGRALSVSGRTQSYLLNEVNFRGQRQLYPHGIGVLEWNGSNDHSFSFFGESWIQEYTWENYKEKLRALS